MRVVGLGFGSRVRSVAANVCACVVPGVQQQSANKKAEEGRDDAQVNKKQEVGIAHLKT